MVFPSCVNMAAKTTQSCTGVLAAQSNLGSGAVCAISGQTLVLSNLYNDFKTSNSTVIEYSLKFSAAHTCGSTDYVGVSALSTLGLQPLETAVVRS